MGIIFRLMNSAVSRWALLVALPSLVLGVGWLFGQFEIALAVAFFLTWILAGDFLAWGNYAKKELSIARTACDVAKAELEEALGQIRESARNDPLTGAANQRFLYEILRQEWGRAERTGSPLALVLTEFDGYESYVDRFGDHAGDALLRQAAEIIGREIKRPGDLLARLGGKRFAVLLPDTDLDGASLIAERLRQAMVLQCVGMGPEEVTLSAGVAVRMPSTQQNDGELLEMARVCLAAAKRTGGDRSLTQDQMN
ncbi:MAG: GGDEF domain-containing protein [Gammaproteobacteria bacterium]|nr:GGDEF domain-containing protein [Gammaproteobacteria bacterium]